LRTFLLKENRLGKQTTIISLKNIALLFPAGSLERVYLHGKWQIERGRNPSMNYGNYPTPRHAFVALNEMLGAYFDEIRHQEYSRQHWFWRESMIEGVKDRIPVSKLPLPKPYRRW
jgi:hypothetical protein